MRNVIGWIIIIGGLLLGAYVGLYLMFIYPILQCCRAYDAGTLTAFQIGVYVLECIFAMPCGGSIIGLMVVSGSFIKS